MSIKVEYEQLKKKEIQKENRLFKNSNIIKLEDEDMIINWFDKKPVNFKLLLDSKIHGDSTSTFINNCAKKCPTIVFVKTTNGCRFGGFTSVLWSYNGYANDKKSFLFSLDKKKKYDINKPECANFYYNTYFYFGGGADLCIYNNCTSNNSNQLGRHSFSTPENYEINDGQQYFVVSSYEVYQLEY